jgi:transposase
MSAKIAFVDESGFSQRPSVRRTWAPRGQTPIIKHNFNWKRINATGAICCTPEGTEPILQLQLQEMSVNADSMIAFLDGLHREVDGPVVLIWDGLPVHRSKKVTSYINEHSWLTVERLPAYAPELNPVEYLWAAFKNKDLANVCAASIEQLGGYIERAYKRAESEPATLQGCLRAAGLYGRHSNST